MPKDQWDNNLSDKDYNGVIYTPSSSSADDTNVFSSNKPIKKKKKKTAYKSQYNLFMKLTVSSGILICIIVFSVVYISFSSKSTATNSNNVNQNDPLKPLSVNESSTSEENKEDENIEVTEKTGVIKNLNMSTKELTIYEIKENKSYNLKASGTTELKNKYSEVITLAELSIGDIIDFNFGEDNNLTSIKGNSEAWEHKSVTDIKLNSSSSTISHGNNTYKYNDMTVVKYNNKDYDISNLDPIDIVTIKGYNDIVWSIIVQKGHGNIQINNKDLIKNGVIEIDTSIYQQLQDANTIKISEGTHKIVVRGSNIEAFSREIVVTANETFNLDLSATQTKTGILIIKANEDDYTLLIDNKPELSREPLILEYGTYNIKVQKEGYVGFETQVTINNETPIEITAEIKKEVKMGTLTVNTNPSGASLYVDNVYVGLTPISTQLTHGQHAIVVKKQGYKDISLSSININERETVYNIDLQIETASFNNNNYEAPTITEPTTSTIENSTVTTTSHEEPTI